MSNVCSLIKCFKHCNKGKHISCFEIPTKCPICQDVLRNCAFAVPPFFLPSPFCYSSEESLISEKHACKILIKPTNGDFLNTYKSGDDLHIGITDTRGEIYSFDQDGVTVQSIGWPNCISLTIVSEENSTIQEIWDACLKEHAQKATWLPCLYEEDSNNCFTFVLEFLKIIFQKDYTKKEFTENYLLPVTKRAADYITIYRKIVSDGVFIHHY